MAATSINLKSMISIIKHSDLWLKGELLPRYQRLQYREQRLLLLTAILLPVVVIVFGLLLPLQEYKEGLVDEVKSVQQLALEAEQLALTLKQKALNGGDNDFRTGNLLSIVEQLARQTNVRRFMTRIQPHFLAANNDQQLKVKLKNVPYADAVRFTNELALMRLNLVRIKINAGAGKGVVNLQLLVGN